IDEQTPSLQKSAEENDQAKSSQISSSIEEKSVVEDKSEAQQQTEKLEGEISPDDSWGAAARQILSVPVKAAGDFIEKVVSSVQSDSSQHETDFDTNISGEKPTTEPLPDVDRDLMQTTSGELTEIMHQLLNLEKTVVKHDDQQQQPPSSIAKSLTPAEIVSRYESMIEHVESLQKPLIENQTSAAETSTPGTKADLLDTIELSHRYDNLIGKLNTLEKGAIKSIPQIGQVDTPHQLRDSFNEVSDRKPIPDNSTTIQKLSSTIEKVTSTVTDNVQTASPSADTQEHRSTELKPSPSDDS
ncbi:unnamed protein product, partial [Didymodactylos carnosus]